MTTSDKIPDDKIPDDKIPDSSPLRLLSFGELLWDLFEGEERIGGAAFNLAAHAARCGLEAHLLSRVGHDDLGHRALEAARHFDVATDAIQIDPQNPTGTVTVTISQEAGREGQPTYTIHAPVAWDFIAADPDTLEHLTAKPFDVVCFGTLAQRGEVSRASLLQLLDACKTDTLFFDINLRQHYYSKEIVTHGLQHATILKLNDEELPILAAMLYSKPSESLDAAVIHKTFETLERFSENDPIRDTMLDIVDDARSNLLGRPLKSEQQELVDFAHALQRDYPQLRTILITQGSKGCLVVDGDEVTSVPGKPVKVVDSVGAGDAFSAAFLAARLKGHTAQEAAQAGNDLGARIVGIRGAIE